MPQVAPPKKREPKQFRRFLESPPNDILAEYDLGKIVGRGQFGTTRVAVQKATNKKFACKSIAKRKMKHLDDIEDVKREIEVLAPFVIPKLFLGSPSCSLFDRFLTTPASICASGAHQSPVLRGSSALCLLPFAVIAQMPQILLSPVSYAVSVSLSWLLLDGRGLPKPVVLHTALKCTLVLSWYICGVR